MFLTQSEAGAQHALLQKRVFPTAHSISTSGLVMICGGGQWGLAEQAEEYKECEIWDAVASTRIPSGNYMQYYRAGLAGAVYEEGEVVKMLFVGGHADTKAKLELYKSNTKQRDQDGGSFVEVEVPDFPAVFFPALTAIGNNRFVMTGGVNWNGTKFDQPSENNAWLLRVVPIEGGDYVVGNKIGGLGVGRYFHTAQAPSGNLLTVVGGFTASATNSLEPTGDVRFLYSTGEDQYELRLPPETESVFATPRGGMASLLLDNDTILMAGGIQGPGDLPLDKDEAGALEIYTPSLLYNNEEGIR